MGRLGGLGAPLFLLFWGGLPDPGPFGGMAHQVGRYQEEVRP